MPGLDWLFPGPAILRALNRIEQNQEKIMASQDDINAAVQAEQGEVADLEAKDTAIAAAQQQLVTEISTLQGQGVDTSGLVTATAALLQAQGADDTAVQALTDAANQNAPAPAPAPSNPPAGS